MYKNNANVLPSSFEGWRHLVTTFLTSFTPPVLSQSLLTPHVSFHISIGILSIPKSGFLACLLHRAYIISSSWFNFHKECYFLLNNNYPVGSFYSCLSRFFCKQFFGDGSTNKVNQHTTTYFSLPFIGHHTQKLGRKLLRLVQRSTKERKFAFLTTKV